MGIKIFSGTDYVQLANDIANHLQVSLGSIQIDKFSDGEILPCFKESIRDLDIFFVNSTSCFHSFIVIY